MDYQTAITQVVSIVKRPDKMGEIRWAINAAIDDLVRRDKFGYDLYQLDFPILEADKSSSIQNVPYTAFTTVKPRHIESITTDTDANSYTEIKPKNIVLNGKARCGVFYKRNDMLVIKTRVLANTIKVSYYAAPPLLSQDTDTHWTLEHAFSAIVARACYHVFSTIGQDKDTAVYERKSEIAYSRIAQEMT